MTAFTVDAEDLRTLLDRTAPASKAAWFGTPCVELVADDDHLEAWAADGCLGISAEEEAADVAPGKVVVPHALLAGLADRLTGPVRCVLSDDGKDLSVHGGHVAAKVRTLPDAELPQRAAPPSEWSRVDAARLKRALESCLPCVASGQDRPHLTGVHVRVDNDEGGWWAASADGFRAALACFDEGGGLWPDDGLTIPTPSARALSALLDGGVVTLGMSGRQLVAVGEGWLWATALLHGDWSHALATARRAAGEEKARSLVADRKALLAALQTVKPFARTHPSDRRHRGLWLAPKAGDVTLRGSDADAGSASATVACDAEGNTEGGAVLLDAGYLADALTAASAERVRLGLGTPAQPVVVREEPDAGATWVIVPMIETEVR